MGLYWIMHLKLIHWGSPLRCHFSFSNCIKDFVLHLETVRSLLCALERNWPASFRLAVTRGLKQPSLCLSRPFWVTSKTLFLTCVTWLMQLGWTWQTQQTCVRFLGEINKDFLQWLGTADSAFARLWGAGVDSHTHEVFISAAVIQVY